MSPLKADGVTGVVMAGLRCAERCAELRSELAEVRGQLWDYWWSYHEEHCHTTWPHDGLCSYPPPTAARERTP